MAKEATIAEVVATVDAEIIARHDARTLERASRRNAVASGVVYAKPVWNAEHAAQIETMIGLGLSPMECSEVLKLQYVALERIYKREISTGVSKVKITVGQALMKVAKDPSHPKQVDAAKFILARRGGESWQEPAATKTDDKNSGDTFIFHAGKIERDI